MKRSYTFIEPIEPVEPIEAVLQSGKFSQDAEKKAKSLNAEINNGRPLLSFWVCRSMCVCARFLLLCWFGVKDSGFLPLFVRRIWC